MNPYFQEPVLITKYQPDTPAEQLIQSEEKQRCNNHHDEHHDRGDHSFTAGWPCDFRSLGSHLLNKGEWINFGGHVSERFRSDF